MERIYSKRETTSVQDLGSRSDNEIILFFTSYLRRGKSRNKTE